ncbi:hypothetical protein PVK06_033159 [Gossypium arboreum]|uniref:Gnk2-homologous domain-containing protein n=1 Tax=Gossypium arboreum TaxID=29729 RepID=A0ABR0NAM0_GOSAR|nr:hypothetical protein PVK06_033159 [Gossypium arboreum]
MMNDTTNQAANTPEGAKKFATREEDANFSSTFEALYTLGQCTPDLISMDCNRCLRMVISRLPTGWQGARVLNPSCNVRYEIYPFYNQTGVASPPSPAPPPPAPGGNGRRSWPIIVAIVVPIAASILLLLLMCWLLKRRAKKKYDTNVGYDITTIDSLQHDYATIEAATDKFSDANKLGEGGFGEVYKVLLLPLDSDPNQKTRFHKPDYPTQFDHKKNSDFYETEGAQDLISYAWKLWKDGRSLELLDPVLRDNYSRNEVIRCIQLGLLCVQEDPADRPTMATVVLLLNSYSATLQVPKQPAFVLQSRTDGRMPDKGLESDQSTSQSMPWSNNEVSITELYPR